MTTYHIAFHHITFHHITHALTSHHVRTGLSSWHTRTERNRQKATRTRRREAGKKTNLGAIPRLDHLLHLAIEDDKKFAGIVALAVDIVAVAQLCRHHAPVPRQHSWHGACRRARTHKRPPSHQGAVSAASCRHGAHIGLFMHARPGKWSGGGEWGVNGEGKGARARAHLATIATSWSCSVAKMGTLSRICCNSASSSAVVSSARRRGERSPCMHAHRLKVCRQGSHPVMTACSAWVWDKAAAGRCAHVVYWLVGLDVHHL